MNRRDFILSASVAAATLTRPSSATPTTAASIPAIDTHIHLYDPTRIGGIPWPAKTDSLLYRPRLPENFCSTVAPFHVVGTVVVEASDWIEDNQWILDLAKTNREIVGFIGNLRPGHPGFAENLRRFSADPIFRGLRLKASDLANLGHPSFDADLRLVADSGLTVDVLGGPSILASTTRLARLLPTLRIVVDHLPFKEWDGNVAALRTALAHVSTQSNVFLKISEIVRRVDGEILTDPSFYQPTFDALLDLVGPARALYGSNWPVSDRVAPYASVYQVASDYFAGQNRAVAEHFFWKNSLSVYRWLPRGAAAALVS